MLATENDHLPLCSKTNIYNQYLFSCALLAGVIQ